MNINRHYLDLQDSYLFATVAEKIAAYEAQNPDQRVIRLGIGDVTRPLCRAAVEAMEQAVREQGTAAGFHGYGPYQGYDFLQDALRQHYAAFGVTLERDEIFVSDGAKSDVGNILDIFAADNRVLVPDPVYPVYVDTNIMAGRRVFYADATAENGFLPLPDEKTDADIVYLCSPNNPTGAVYDRAGLKAWVDYARARDAVILFDAAYECFVTRPELPHSIYEVEGARECAIEIGSFSKTAGFTGTRCGYTVVPLELKRGGVRLRDLWLRRQSTKFNGVSYVVQRGAAAVLSGEGQRQIRADHAYYMENAAIMADALREMGVWFVGGEQSPYVWFRCPEGDSWAFFDRLLTRAQVAGTPGAGFGRNGEGYFRLTAFGTHEDTQEAMRRFIKAL
ncbi:MAG: LL-diaminopimelate aminotransferase [Eubacteriales bacterium]|nr:LL-diaminopimelate aminotransferase [Eubacteriales bacterium]